jgi:hypothetical protein
MPHNKYFEAVSHFPSHCLHWRQIICFGFQCLQPIAESFKGTYFEKLKKLPVSVHIQFLL